MRALDPVVVDVVWAAVEPILPVRSVSHPLGCHRQRIPDRVCFQGILLRLAFGCSWEDTERMMEGRVSDTTLRARRDEWVKAGVFDRLVEESIAAYDRIIGLDLSEVSVDGSQHKAPCGGEGTGKNPADRAKLGWKWSLAADANGIPLGWTTAGANQADILLLEPTLDQVTARGLTMDIETLHLDRGYHGQRTHRVTTAAGITDLVTTPRRRPGEGREPKSDPLGQRWTIERTNSWLSNFGQLRRNTDRRIIHRLAQLALAITFIITAKLIDRHKRWHPQPIPIR